VKLKIREKILIITVTTFLLATGVNTLFISRMFREGYSAALQSKMDVIANTLRSQMERLLSLGIDMGDIEGFEAQCQEILHKHKEVAYVMVTRVNGEILFHNDPARHDTMINDPGILKALKHGRQTACTSEVSGRTYYNTVVPVQNGSNEPTVAVVVGFPTKLIDDKVQELRQDSFMVALASLSFATFLLLFGLSISVTKPLSSLVTTIQRIRDSSDLDRKVMVESTDEIGVLANAFNNMTGNLKVLVQKERKFAAQAAIAEIERKRAAELEKAYKELERVNQELKDFAYIAAHDLKAPLRAIGSLAGIISTDYADKLDEQGKELLKMLVGRTQRMSNQITSILYYSEIGQVEEKRERVDLNLIVREVISSIDVPKNIEVTIENELPTIICEKTRITQVFQNLLSNAVKYMDKPKGQIRIGCVEEDSFWRFSVADNGCGIEEKYFGKIFQLFQTLKRRDEVESTGIGLSLVKKIVEIYNGSVWVESQPDQGSTFFFTLPKQETEVKNEELQANIVS
jgi:signal transduction histidine kinase